MPLPSFAKFSFTRSAPTYKAGEKSESRSYTLRISFAGLVTALVIMAIALGWIFALGVIIGRGYNPEEKLPEIAKLLPPQEKEPAKPEILKPEELTFLQDLKQNKDTPRPMLKPAVAPASNPAESASASPAATKPAIKPVDKPAEPTEKVEKYNYVFQAASFKTSAQADALRKNLEKAGLRTVLKKDSKGKWYKVEVLFRGAENEVASVKETLAKCKVKNPQLLSKTAVNTSATKAPAKASAQATTKTSAQAKASGKSTAKKATAKKTTKSSTTKTKGTTSKKTSKTAVERKR